MRPAAHLRLFLVMTLVWAAFWVLGLPDYYLNRPFWVKASASAAILTAIFAAGWISLGRVWPERRMRVALWLSVYTTVPFAIYDFLYCALYLGYGLRFVIPFWYLSIFYVIPWLLFPLTARARAPISSEQR